MCGSSSSPTVETYKAAKPAATPPSPIEAPKTIEPADTASKKKKATAKGKLALTAAMSTPESSGLNVFS